MIRYSVLFFSLLLFSVCATGLLQAQEAPTDAERSLLPEIDPQDIEIRSQFQARFPGLRRQPILGFNPRPRVFQTDPDRIPFIEDEETVTASLPVGELDRPEAPGYTPLGYRDPQNAFIRAGIGSEISPEADIYAVAKLNDRNWISGHTNFNSSDGHEENVTTSYRFFDAGVKTYSRLSDRTNLQLSAGVKSNFNHMLQLGTADEELLNVDTRVSLNGFRGSAALDVASTSMTGTKIKTDGFFHDFSIESDLAELTSSPSEWGVRAEGEYSRLGSNINEVHRLKVQTHAGGLESMQGVSGNWSVTTVSAHYERLFNYRSDVKASLGVSGVSDAEDDFMFRFSPNLELKHTFFRGFNIRAKASAEPRHHTYQEIHAQNRFFDFQSNLRHQYEILALGEVQMEPFYGTKIIAGVSYQDIRNYLYYTRNEQPVSGFDIDERYYSAAFRDATIFRIYGGFSQDLRPDVLWFSADAHLQTPRFSNEEKIPFVENFSVQAALSFRPTRQVLLEGWGEFANSRETHTGEDLPSFLLIGGKFEISISDRYGVYGKLLNLLDEDYQLWQGYREHGFQGFVGFTYLF